MNKYIDADKLKTRLNKHIELLENGDAHPEVMKRVEGVIQGYKATLSIIDSLPDENNPEPYNPVYDEDYLNEKIAKATKSWEGVDVDKMLADCRGYEEPDESLDEVANRYTAEHYYELLAPGDLANAFLAGAEWQKEKMLTDAVDLEKEIDSEWKKCLPIDEGMGVEVANIHIEAFDIIARYFYGLGQSMMRKRFTGPEYNQGAIEKMKSECPADESNARKEE